MLRRFAFVLALAASPAVAETVVTCPGGQPVVPDRVTFYATSQHGPSFPGSLIDPDLSAVLAFPWQEWKCVGATVVRMTQGERDAIDAAELAAREALALSLYGQTGCDLTSGDQFIGLCQAGEVLTSAAFTDAVLDVIKRRLDVADKEYLVRSGANIIGAPAMPTGDQATGQPNFSVTTVEQAITGATVTFTRSNPLSRYGFYASVRLTKDTGTTARVVTLRLRRASDNGLVGVPCVIRSQPLATTEMGACTWFPIEVNPPAGAETYALTAIVGAGNATVTAFELRLQEGS